MPEGRPVIPADLQRDLLVEAGHRCAIPACRATPTVFEHIEDWARVKEHTFHNMIVLCPNCHAQKGKGPQKIDRKSLKQYKANLAVLNSRYGEIERRLMEHCALELAKNRQHAPYGGRPVVTLGFGSTWQVMYLLRDGYLERLPGVPMQPSISGIPLYEEYVFTEAGVEFVRRWAEARPLDATDNTGQE